MAALGHEEKKEKKGKKKHSHPWHEASRAPDGFFLPR
jgi:hypothetical protein